MLTYEVFKGAELAGVVSDLARLRVAVFRDWPYLYEGDMDYERDYLARYAKMPGAVLVAARDGQQLVGASTGTPMEDHADDFRAAFEGTGLALHEVFYLAESVLLPAYRGQGAGHVFFDEREAHARRLGRKYACFCAVERPQDHPLRPADYRPLDGFWRKRGYAKLDGVKASFDWKDVDMPQSNRKSLQFWSRAL